MLVSTNNGVQSVKLHPANFTNQNIFTGYGQDYVMINQVRYDQSLIVLPEQLIQSWPVQTIQQLEFRHFDDLLPSTPEIVLLGTGSKLLFPNQSILNQFARLRIGFEIMDTYACCRTYNILVEENRQIAAAILI